MVQLGCALHIGGFASLFVDLEQPGPNAADQLRGFPRLQLEFVNLLRQFLKDGAGEAIALARQAYFGEHQLSLKAAAAASFTGGEPGHFGESLLHFSGTNQYFSVVPGARRD